MTRTLIVMGASAGGVETLSTIVRSLPANLPAAVVIVLHVPQRAVSNLPSVLERAGVLPVRHAEAGAELVPGNVYVAPPGHHLHVQEGRIELSRGPKENRHRPSIDVTFRTAAHTYGPRAIGVILSGAGGDGTAGLQAIKAAGGIAVVQDPEDALYPAMPRNARAHVAVDVSAPAAELGAVLTRLTREGPAGRRGAVKDGVDEAERVVIAVDKAEQERGARANSPSVLSCPGCGGVLWEMAEDRLLRYRCHVGHTFTMGSLQEAHAEALEAALWSAVRLFRERAMLSRRSVTRAREQGLDSLVANLEARAADAERCASLIERLLMDAQHVESPPAEEDP